MGRSVVFAPALIAGALLAAAAGLLAAGVPVPPYAMLAGALLVAVVAWIGYDLSFQKPARRLLIRLAEAGIPQPAAPAPIGPGLFRVLEDGLVRLSAAYAGAASKALQEGDARREAEFALHESEARHALAIRCANEGIWELDLTNQALELSPSIRAILGHSAAEGRDSNGSITRWDDFVHPDDLVSVLGHIEDHVQGRTPLIDVSYRARCGNGEFRWLLSRGRALRTASGRPYKVIGVASDITQRKRAEDVLHGIASGMMTSTGDDFFRRIVRNFAQVLGVDFAFITRCKDNPPTEVEMLAAWQRGDFVAPWDFKLAGTPCEITLGERRTTVICEGVGGRFPIDEEYESYLGIPIFGHRGELLGHLACFADRTTVEEPHLEPIFNVFAVRAGLEIEHQRLFAQLTTKPRDEPVN